MRQMLSPRRRSRRAFVVASMPVGEDAGAQTTAPAASAKPDIRPATPRAAGRVGRPMRLRGTVTPAGRGRRVSLQIARPAGWKTIARTRTRAGGRYALRLRPRQAFSARARVAARAPGGRRAWRNLGRLEIYRVAAASWYGPGLYGGSLACGGRLAPGTLGVAHKTLPCGSRISLRLGGRSVRVAVVDRGPYVGAREFDLTAATRARLGFAHGTVWVAH